MNFTSSKKWEAGDHTHFRSEVSGERVYGRGSMLGGKQMGWPHTVLGFQVRITELGFNTSLSCIECVHCSHLPS